MRKYSLLIAWFSILVGGCAGDDNLNTEPPVNPDTVKFDINNDGFDDIQFKFYADDILTDGTAGYVGDVEPLNGGFLLISTAKGHNSIFENDLNDTIRKGETDNSIWYPSNLIFMSIDDSPKGIWPDEWTISGQKASNPYYLGIQVKENDVFLIGWLKLEISKKTAKIDILKYKLTSEDFIVIDE